MGIWIGQAGDTNFVVGSISLIFKQWDYIGSPKEWEC